MEQGQQYLVRLDRHAAGLSPTECRAFLCEQLKTWERRYARFLCTEGASDPGYVADDPPHCSNFLLTICEISARIARLPR